MGNSIYSTAIKWKSFVFHKKVSNFRTKEGLVITQKESPSALENETQKIMEKTIRRCGKKRV